MDAPYELSIHRWRGLRFRLPEGYSDLDCAHQCLTIGGVSRCDSTAAKGRHLTNCQFAERGVDLHLPKRDVSGEKSAQFHLAWWSFWRARQDKTGHSYVIVIPTVS